MTFNVNDFFCGCGGIGLGFKQAGFNVQWAVDFDKFAVKSYAHNVGDHVIQKDVKELKGEDVPIADVWAFGFPCTDLSTAGQRQGFQFRCNDCETEFSIISEEDRFCPHCGMKNFTPITRSGMFFEIMRLLDEVSEENKPKILLAENVKGLKKYIPIIKREFKEHGYTAHIKLFNSKYWGVPQQRERYFIVGTKDNEKLDFDFPIENTEKEIPKLSFILNNKVEDKYYIDKEKANKIIEQAILRLPELKDVHACITPGRLEKRQNGRRAKENEKEMFTITATDIHGIICKETGLQNPNGISKTLRAEDHGTMTKGRNVRHILQEDYIVRKLTPTEYGRLQGFPMNEWEQVVSDSQAYKQFGNSVTVPLVKEIALKIKESLEEKGE